MKENEQHMNLMDIIRTYSDRMEISNFSVEQISSGILQAYAIDTLV